MIEIFLYILLAIVALYFLIQIIITTPLFWMIIEHELIPFLKNLFKRK